MTKTKRATIKGKGADIFLEQKNHDDGITESHNNGITENHNTINTANKLAVMPANQIKVTYFINGLIADQLEDLWLTLRKKFKNRKISKSRITEFALDNLIKDWEKNQDNSLIEILLKGKKEK